MWGLAIVTWEMDHDIAFKLNACTLQYFYFVDEHFLETFYENLLVVVLNDFKMLLSTKIRL